MRMSWAACRKADATGNRFIFGRTLSRKPDAVIAFIESGRRHEHEASISRTLPAGESYDVVRGGIVRDHVHELLDRVVHDRERRVLRALHAAEDDACVLRRKEPLGDLDDQYEIQDDREEQHKHGRAWIFDHQLSDEKKRCSESIPSKIRSACSIEFAVLCVLLVLEDISAHHRRSGKRNHHRNQNCGR